MNLLAFLGRRALYWKFIVALRRLGRRCTAGLFCCLFEDGLSRVCRRLEGCGDLIHLLRDPSLSKAESYFTQMPPHPMDKSAARPLADLAVAARQTHQLTAKKKNPETARVSCSLCLLGHVGIARGFSRANLHRRSQLTGACRATSGCVKIDGVHVDAAETAFRTAHLSRPDKKANPR